MITRILVEHYKSVERVDLKLGPLTVLVGPNGIGKSNFVDAVRFIRDAATLGLSRAVADRHGIDSIRQWSPGKPHRINLRAEVENDVGRGYFGFTLSSHRGTHTVEHEEGLWELAFPSGPIVIRYTRGSEGNVQVFEGETGMTLLRADQQEELYLTQFEAFGFRRLVAALGSMEAYSIYPNDLRTPQKITNDQRLSHNGDNLTSVFKRLTQSKRQDYERARNEILSALRKVMPSLESVQIRSLGGLMAPVFRVRESNGKVHDFNVAQLSDGTLRVLGILTALYQPHRPDVVALEEPEQMINPGVLAVLAEAIEEASSTSQVIVTTHSPELLDKFADPAVVLAVEMRDGVTRIGPISEDQLSAVRERLFSLGELMTVEGLHT
ncbi:MAG TPA: AAA family ATPase [Longimicrobium sp.]|nr:AAA family ATPase [Longimicrobium sp.]